MKLNASKREALSLTCDALGKRAHVILNARRTCVMYDARSTCVKLNARFTCVMFNVRCIMSYLTTIRGMHYCVVYSLVLDATYDVLTRLPGLRARLQGMNVC